MQGNVTKAAVEEENYPKTDLWRQTKYHLTHLSPMGTSAKKFSGGAHNEVYLTKEKETRNMPGGEAKKSWWGRGHIFTFWIEKHCPADILKTKHDNLWH